MRKVKVLIADDIKAIAEYNKKIVSQNENIDVIAIAENGQEEYDIIMNFRPDLVITDNKMPKMNGIDVIEKIVNSDLTIKPQFILITADLDRYLYKKCKELNVLQVMRKPIKEEILLDTIDRFISSSRNAKFDKNENIKDKKRSFISKIFEKYKKVE